MINSTSALTSLSSVIHIDNQTLFKFVTVNFLPDSYKGMEIELEYVGNLLVQTFTTTGNANWSVTSIPAKLLVKKDGTKIIVII